MWSNTRRQKTKEDKIEDSPLVSLAKAYKGIEEQKIKKENNESALLFQETWLERNGCMRVTHNWRVEGGLPFLSGI